MQEAKLCPQCGAPIKRGANKCEYCKAELFITGISVLSNFDNSGIQKYIKYYTAEIKADSENTEAILGLGLCYLQLDMYDKAKKLFDQVIDTTPEIAPAYYYYSLSVVAGNKIKNVPISDIEKIEIYLNAALTFDPENNLYLLLLLIIKYEWYIKNGMREKSPTYQELKDMVNIDDIDQEEIERLKKSAPVSDFTKFNI